MELGGLLKHYIYIYILISNNSDFVHMQVQHALKEIFLNATIIFWI